MKIISLWQPWATLWAGGKKINETRDWPLRLPLPAVLAVHAAKNFPAELQQLCRTHPFRSALADLGYADPMTLPLGAVVGAVRVCRIWRTFKGHLTHWKDDLHVPLPREPERSFGDYSDGRCAWETDRRVTFQKPIPLKGRQSVFNWDPPEDLAVMLAALAAQGYGTCRVCGCTEEDCRQCIEKTGAPCWWVEPDLCSACVPKEARCTT